MSRMTRKYQVVFDSEGGKFFSMIIPDREIIFQMSPKGLYYFDAVDRENSVLLLNTLAYNRKGLTRKEHEGDWEARRSMHLIGFPSERDFGNMVCSNMILKCPVTFEDVKSAKLIFGPDITSLKIKSVSHNPDSVVTD